MQRVEPMLTAKPIVGMLRTIWDNLLLCFPKNATVKSDCGFGI